MVKLRLRNPRNAGKKTQGTPVVGYHDEDGHLVIPKEFDDEYDKD